MIMRAQGAHEGIREKTQHQGPTRDIVLRFTEQRDIDPFSYLNADGNSCNDCPVLPWGGYSGTQMPFGLCFRKTEGLRELVSSSSFTTRQSVGRKPLRIPEEVRGS